MLVLSKLSRHIKKLESVLRAQKKSSQQILTLSGSSC